MRSVMERKSQKVGKTKPNRFWNFLTNATLRSAVNENPSIATSTGYEVNPDTGVVTQDSAALDKTARPELANLRNNLAVMSGTAYAAPAAPAVVNATASVLKTANALTTTRGVTNLQKFTHGLAGLAKSIIGSEAGRFVGKQGDKLINKIDSNYNKPVLEDALSLAGGIATGGAVNKGIFTNKALPQFANTLVGKTLFGIGAGSHLYNVTNNWNDYNTYDKVKNAAYGLLDVSLIGNAVRPRSNFYKASSKYIDKAARKEVKTSLTKNQYSNLVKAAVRDQLNIKNEVSGEDIDNAVNNISNLIVKRTYDPYSKNSAYKHFIDIGDINAALIDRSSSTNPALKNVGKNFSLKGDSNSVLGKLMMLGKDVLDKDFDTLLNLQQKSINPFSLSSNVKGKVNDVVKNEIAEGIDVARKAAKNNEAKGKTSLINGALRYYNALAHYDKDPGTVVGESTGGRGIISSMFIRNANNIARAFYNIPTEKHPYHGRKIDKVPFGSLAIKPLRALSTFGDTIKTLKQLSKVSPENHTPFRVTYNPNGFLKFSSLSDYEGGNIRGYNSGRFLVDITSPRIQKFLDTQTPQTRKSYESMFSFMKPVQDPNNPNMPAFDRSNRIKLWQKLEKEDPELATQIKKSLNLKIDYNDAGFIGDTSSLDNISTKEDFGYGPLSNWKKGRTREFSQIEQRVLKDENGIGEKLDPELIKILNKKAATKGQHFSRGNQGMFRFADKSAADKTGYTQVFVPIKNADGSIDWYTASYDLWGINLDPSWKGQSSFASLALNHAQSKRILDKTPWEKIDVNNKGLLSKLGASVKGKLSTKQRQLLEDITEEIEPENRQMSYRSVDEGLNSIRGKTSDLLGYGSDNNIISRLENNSNTEFDNAFVDALNNYYAKVMSYGIRGTNFGKTRRSGEFTSPYALYKSTADRSITTAKTASRLSLGKYGRDISVFYKLNKINEIKSRVKSGELDPEQAQYMIRDLQLEDNNGIDINAIIKELKSLKPSVKSVVKSSSAISENE